MAAISKYVTVEAPVEKVYAYWRDYELRELHAARQGGNAGRRRRLADALEGRRADGHGGRVGRRARRGRSQRADCVAFGRGLARAELRGRPLRLAQRPHRRQVSIDYEPPAGVAGEAAARMFENPEQQVETRSTATRSSAAGSQRTKHDAEDGVAPRRLHERAPVGEEGGNPSSPRAGGNGRRTTRADRGRGARSSPC